VREYAQRRPRPAGRDGTDGQQRALLRSASWRHVERTINRLKGWRRVATRYEKREVNYLAMVTIAAMMLRWLE
jgi:transposase